jgi:hypothetical protein
MQSDATAYIIAAAALAVAAWSYIQTSDLQAKINACQAEYQGFKEGVIYER